LGLLKSLLASNIFREENTALFGNAYLFLTSE